MTTVLPVSAVSNGMPCNFHDPGKANHDSQNSWADLTARHRMGAKHSTSPIPGSVQQAGQCSAVARGVTVCFDGLQGCMPFSGKLGDWWLCCMMGG